MPAKSVSTLSRELRAANAEVTRLNGEVTNRDNTITVLTGERDTLRAEVTRLNGEVANRDNTITLRTGERDTARTECTRNRKRCTQALWGLGVAAALAIGLAVWALVAQNGASDAKQAASLAEQAKVAAEKGLATTEAEMAKLGGELVTAKADKAKVDGELTTIKADKDETERKLAEAEKAKEAAEKALADAQKAQPAPTAVSVVTPNPAPNGTQIPDGEVQEAKILQTYKRGAVVRAIGRPGPVNGRTVQPLFEVPGEIVVSMRYDQNLEEFVRNLSFDGIPKEALPDPRRIQPIRTVVKDGVIYHQLGVVQ